MGVDVVVPEVGELGMDVTIVRWLKSPGDPVAVGDILFELDTDKTVVEVEAWIAGTLAEIIAAPGDTVAPRQVVARISTGEAQIAATEAVKGTAIGGVPATSPDVSSAAGQARPGAHGGAVRASPRARRLAAEHGVDLASVQGTGPDGLVVERDVLGAAGRADPPA